MFLGESLCLVYLLVHRRIYKKNFISNEDFARFTGKYPPSNWIFSVSATCDFLASFLQYIAITFTNGSTFQILRSCTLISTALSVRLLTKMRFKKHHKYGFLFAFVGLLIVGSSDFIITKEDHSELYSRIIGIALMMVSIVFAGICFAY